MYVFMQAYFFFLGKISRYGVEKSYKVIHLFWDILNYILVQFMANLFLTVCLHISLTFNIFQYGMIYK